MPKITNNGLDILEENIKKIDEIIHFTNNGLSFLGASLPNDKLELQQIILHNVITLKEIKRQLEVVKGIKK